MSNIAVRVEGLSKKYKIGLRKQRHNTLRDELVYSVKSLFKGKDRPSNGADPSDILWAINDVSFDVKHGEILGILGRNGAGKSTLLKILSRITAPTRGRVEIFGRVGSLLEVGTGFHSELTGRENIYLNGAILGMHKAEIDRKFDEIVAFSEVEKFIDTPVKRYSSGMHVRLAFAVAAHLEPEILIIDEVLAVGDINFQNKCIGKMGDVARQGRTVLFVSHNMGAVTNLCTTALWLDQGGIKMRGDVKSVVGSYIKNQPAGSGADTKDWKRRGTGDARIVKARLLDSKGDDCVAFMMGETVVVELDVEFHRSFPSAYFTVEINRKEMGLRVLELQSDDCEFAAQQHSPGMRRFRVEIPNCLLYPTSYEINLCIWIPNTIIDYVEGVIGFSMIQSNVTKRTQPLTRHKEAIFYAPAVWRDVPLEVHDSANH